MLAEIIKGCSGGDESVTANKLDIQAARVTYRHTKYGEAFAVGSWGQDEYRGVGKLRTQGGKGTPGTEGERGRGGRAIRV